MADINKYFLQTKYTTHIDIVCIDDIVTILNVFGSTSLHTHSHTYINKKPNITE